MAISADCVKWVCCDDFRCNLFVDDLIDETGVRTVFQQATHQISQQIAVCTNWRIDTAAGVVVLHNHRVHRFAHAMQALEFIRLRIGCHVQNCGDCVGVVCGELGIDAVRHAQQFSRVGDIADVGLCLLGEDGEVFHTKGLG